MTAPKFLPVSSDVSVRVDAVTWISDRRTVGSLDLATIGERDSSGLEPSWRVEPEFAGPWRKLAGLPPLGEEASEAAPAPGSMPELVKRARDACDEVLSECGAYRYESSPTWDAVEERVTKIRNILEGTA